MPTKDDTARALAQLYYQLEGQCLEVYHLRGPNDDDPDEPVRVYEVNILPEGWDGPVCLWPVGGPAMPQFGVHHRTGTLQVAPSVHWQIRSGTLPLPDGYSVGELIPRVVAGTGALATAS